MFGKKEINIEEPKEIVHIKGTERWRDFKKTTKWTGMFILLGLFIIVLYIIFSSYVFGSFFLSLFVSSIVFYNKIEVPSQNYVESRIEIETDLKGNRMPGNYIFNEYKIPDRLIKEFKLKGNTRITWKSKNGKKRDVVEKIDWKNKIIYYGWLSGLTDWEMQVKIDTFKMMKEKVLEIPRDLSRVEETRPLYYGLEFIKLIKDQNKDEELTPQEEKIKQKIKDIFNDKPTKQSDL